MTAAPCDDGVGQGLVFSHRLITTYRFLICWLWFVLGPGGLGESARSGPRTRCFKFKFFADFVASFWTCFDAAASHLDRLTGRYSHKHSGASTTKV